MFAVVLGVFSGAKGNNILSRRTQALTAQLEMQDGQYKPSDPLVLHKIRPERANVVGVLRDTFASFAGLKQYEDANAAEAMIRVSLFLSPLL
jgi:hypothetical protein